MTAIKPLLCRPLDAFVKQPIEVQRQYRRNNYSLAIRPFYVPEDLPVIFKWLTNRYASSLWKNESPKEEQLLETYKVLLDSDYGQSFICELSRDGQVIPVLQVDVTRMLKSERYKNWVFLPGDHSMRIVVWPQLRMYKGAFINAIQLFLEYFLDFPEVDRLVTWLDNAYRQANSHLVKAGFMKVDQVTMMDHPVNVYVGDRESPGLKKLPIRGEEQGL